jgi:hypothetical protein
MGVLVDGQAEDWVTDLLAQHPSMEGELEVLGLVCKAQEAVVDELAAHVPFVFTVSMPFFCCTVTGSPSSWCGFCRL